MDHPFSKSTSSAEKCKRLFEIVVPEDILGILINADPDSMASALALKRLFWRRVKKTLVYRVNSIKRADNLALIKSLKIDLKHIRNMDSTEITKWAILDSQPQHHEQLSRYDFDIIIDHHPPGLIYDAQFVDIKEEYGANSTIMTEYLRASKIRPSPRLATALFYGIKTDTENFARPSIPNDINAFRYLYPFTNIQIIKKIESSEITKKTLQSFQKAIENLKFVKDIASIYMGKVSNPDFLVIIADFFLKLAEAKWCVVSGIYGQKLIVIFRNAGFRLNAGKVAQDLFGELGTAGGHRNAARAEVPLEALEAECPDGVKIGDFVLSKIKVI